MRDDAPRNIKKRKCMTAFEKAFINLIEAEGGYSNDPRDAGKETFYGISRRYHPEWKGWEIIDRMKEHAASVAAGASMEKVLGKLLMKSDRLRKLAMQFYYNNYWVHFNGDALPYAIGEELLEQSVVLGTGKTGAKQLQLALNMLNRNGKLFPDLAVDGVVGRRTLAALKKVNIRRLLVVLNGLEFCRFRDSMSRRPINEVFVGWFDRVRLSLGQSCA